MKPKLKALLIAFVVILPLDQISKHWVDENISAIEPIVVIDGFFHLTHARNPGMAFGLWRGAPKEIFIVLTLIALGLIGSFYRGLDERDSLSALGLGLILSGAIGNLIDRMTRGEVVDFLQFRFGSFTYPDFNIADSAIVCGVALLMLEIISQRTEEEIPEDRDP